VTAVLGSHVTPDNKHDFEKMSLRLEVSTESQARVSYDMLFQLAAAECLKQRDTEMWVNIKQMLIGRSRITTWLINSYVYVRRIISVHNVKR
jgi:hypothetical protein